MDFLNLFLAQAIQSPDKMAQQATQPAGYKDLLITIVPVLTALVGVVTGLITAWKNQSDVYKDRLEQYKSAFDKHLQSLDKAYESEKRSLEILLRQKESDIKKLKSRIKKMEGFYAIHFSDIDKGNDAVERLILFLKYIENKIPNPDDALIGEIKKMELYLKDKLGLSDRQQLRREAAEWLEEQLEKLTSSATDHIWHRLYIEDPLNQSQKELFAEIKDNIAQCLKRLIVMLRAGKGTENDTGFIEKTQEKCSKDKKYLEALNFIKNNLIGGRISSDACEELQNCIDILIEIIFP